MGTRPPAVLDKDRIFFDYARVLAELKISRRTLQRWIDDMDIEPLEFEDQLKVFLVIKQVNRLREYAKIMKTRNLDLINRYRRAVKTSNEPTLAKIRVELLTFLK